MKPKFHLWLGISLSVLLCGIFLYVLIIYSQPMENETYDLSVVKELNEVESVDTCEELGWAVYIQTGETVTPLAFDGLGCFEGLPELGQTFYFSRVMQEELDAPTIQLNASNRNFSLFLDGVLIYTDCPEQDNRIGYLTLPMREWERKENVAVSLPEGYLGKTLTIAQSTPLYVDAPRMATRVIPAGVTLYCAYAYESALIAESFTTACTGAACYLFGLLLIALFIRRLFLGEFDWGMLFLALAVFLSMNVQIYNTSYSLQYFGIPVLISRAMLCQLAMIGVTLAFLSTQAPRLRAVCWGMAAIYAAASVLFILLGRSHPIGSNLFSLFVWHAYEVAGGLFIPIMLILSWFFRRKSDFFRYFAPLSLVGVLLYMGIQLLLPSRIEFITSLAQALKGKGLHRLSYHISVIMMLVSLAIVEVQALRREINLRTERRLMLEMSVMTQHRYQNLLRHNEEIMMLRHDMNRHFQILRQITADEKTAAYLDDLLGKNEKIRPFIQSGNDLLDTILCGRLSPAMDEGIRVELVRTDAPDTLPMTDADLCSLIMNLMDNAIAAARTAPNPMIKLDLHQKSGFFVFVCENSMSPAHAPAEKEKAVPKHGLGLKIVRQIAERYGLLLTMEEGEGSHKVSIAISLPQFSK